MITLLSSIEEGVAQASNATAINAAIGGPLPPAQPSAAILGVAAPAPSFRSKKITQRNLSLGNEYVTAMLKKISICVGIIELLLLNSHTCISHCTYAYDDEAVNGE